jgi:mRNA interferase RelE/StbE
MLGRNPDNPDLDIKPLQGSSQNLNRLRVGQWRVIFNRNEELQIIAIEKIKPRGDAYK